LKKSAEKISHHNLALRAIRSINRLITRDINPQGLLQSACDILIKNRGYDKVWMVVFDKFGRADAWAESGITEGCFPLIEKLKHGEMVDCGQRALSEKSTVLIKNPVVACKGCPLSETHEGWGALTTPLRYKGENYGLLSVSIPKELISDDVEQALVEEIAGDVAFGLYRIKREKEHEKADAALRDRVKELSYLFSFTDIIGKPDVSLEKILQEAVDLLPSAMHYPDIVCARINLDGRKFESVNYQETAFRLSTPIVVNKGTVGTLNVCYLEERQEKEDGPFIIEEQNLIKAISIRIGKTIERKRGRKDLEDSEKRFRDLVENSLTCIAIIQDNTIVYHNPEYVRFFESSIDAFVLPDFKAEHIHPDDVAHVGDAIEQFISGRVRIVDMEFRFCPFGKQKVGVARKWVHCRISMIEYQGKPAILVNIMDVSRAKELEHLLKIKDKMTSLGRVAAGIAHEIRNPLSGINIYLKTLEKITIRKENPEKIANILSQLHSASNKIESVIKRVMDFSRPSEPRLLLTDANQPIEEAVNLSAVTLRKSGIMIETRLAPNLLMCKADPHMVEQVILNLISNASEAMKQMHRNKKIIISSFMEKDRVCIRVSDSGPGVPEDIAGNIFDPFYTTKENSSGIGLSICHRIITDHSGSLDVGTSPLGGAEFIIKLPAECKVSKK